MTILRNISVKGSVPSLANPAAKMSRNLTRIVRVSLQKENGRALSVGMHKYASAFSPHLYRRPHGELFGRTVKEENGSFPQGRA